MKEKSPNWLLSDSIPTTYILRDKHLFDAGMLSEQAMARTIYVREINR
jgi:hypothetical protein